MRHLFFTLFAVIALEGAAPPLIPYADQHKIAVQNSILAKVNGTTISMIDVKKKMDLLFHQNYPHLAESNQARYQFYENSWRPILMELIDHELILSDAADKEIKMTDAEVREELERKFGPNVMGTLDQIGLTYEEAWRLIKNDLIVQRMTWWFVHARALEQVKPQDIRQAYKAHVQEHPGYTEWTYQVLTLRGEALLPAANELRAQIEKSQLSPELLDELFKKFEVAHPHISLSLSKEYRAKDQELSTSHRETFSSLEPTLYSSPVVQKGRDQKEVCRIFYLKNKVETPAPLFEEVAPMVKNELLQKASVEASKNYIAKLRKNYRFDAAHLEETLPSDFKPFSLE